MQEYSWKHYLVGVCPAEPGRPAAVSVVEQVIGYGNHGERRTLRLDQSHLEQVPGGAALEELAERVDGLCRAASRHEGTGRGVVLLVDTTVLGAIPAELMAARRPFRVAVTNAAEEGWSGSAWAVPRRALVGNLLLQVQQGRFRTAGALPLAERFARALREFRWRPPTGAGEDELEAMRREADDDLVLAAALCAWQAGREVPGEPERGSARVRSVYDDERFR